MDIDIDVNVCDFVRTIFMLPGNFNLLSKESASMSKRRGSSNSDGALSRQTEIFRVSALAMGLIELGDHKFIAASVRPIA